MFLVILSLIMQIGCGKSEWQFSAQRWFIPGDELIDEGVPSHYSMFSSKLKPHPEMLFGQWNSTHHYMQLSCKNNKYHNNLAAFHLRPSGMSYCLWIKLLEVIGSRGDFYLIFHGKVKYNSKNEVQNVTHSLMVDRNGIVTVVISNKFGSVSIATKSSALKKNLYQYLCYRIKARNSSIVDLELASIYVDNVQQPVHFSRGTPFSKSKTPEDYSIYLSYDGRNHLPWTTTLIRISDSAHNCCRPFGCVENPCANGGQCREHFYPHTAYKCICPPNYYGRRCHIKGCAIKNCEHGGKCVNKRCKCARGTFGLNCEHYRAEIISSPQTVFVGENVTLLLISTYYNSRMHVKWRIMQNVSFISHALQQLNTLDDLKNLVNTTENNAVKDGEPFYFEMKTIKTPRRGTHLVEVSFEDSARNKTSMSIMSKFHVVIPTGNLYIPQRYFLLKQGEFKNFVVLVKELGDNSSFRCAIGDNMEFTCPPIQYASSVQEIMPLVELLPDAWDGVKKNFPTSFYYFIFGNFFSNYGVTDIVVSAYNLDRRTSTSSIKVVVSKHKCFPEITLVNVGSSMALKPLFRLQDKIILKSRVKKKCDVQISTYLWQLFSLTDDTPAISPSTQFMLPSNVLVNNTYLTIPQYTLPKGNYGVTLFVTATHLGETLFGVKVGWLQVCSSAIMPYIEGGNFRTVSGETNLTFDASLSSGYLSLVTNFSFAWTCWLLGSKKDDSFCEGGSKVLATTPVLQIPAKALQKESNYAVAVKVGEDSDGLAETFVQEVYVEANTAPQVIIQCLDSCQQFINPKDNFILKAHCLSCSEDDVVTYTWKMYYQKGNKKTQLEWDTETAFGRYSDTLAIYNDVLQTGDTYTFVVVVSDNGEEGYSEFKAVVQTPPAGWHCNINPTSGVESKTQFSINCHGPNVAETPIKYCFYYLSNPETFWSIHDKTGKQKRFLIGCRSLPEIKQITLPPGDEQNDNKLTVIISILDSSTGLTTEVKLDVHVMSEFASWQFPFDEFMSDMQQKVSQLEAQMGMGNYEAVLSSLNNFGEKLADKKLKVPSNETLDANMSMEQGKMIDTLSIVPMFSLPMVLSATSALSSLLKMDNVMGINFLNKSFDIMQNVMNKIQEEFGTTYDNPNKMLETFDSMFSSLSRLLLVTTKEGKMFDVLEWSGKSLEPLYENYDARLTAEEIMEEIKDSEEKSKIALQSVELIYNLSDIILAKLLPGQQKILHGNGAQLIVDKITSLQTESKVYGELNSDRVIIPPYAGLSLRDHSDLVNVKIVSTSMNPYAFYDTNTRVNAHVVFSRLEDALKQEVDLAYGSAQVQYYVRRTSNSTFSVDSSVGMKNKHLLSNSDITVHRLVANNASTLHIKIQSITDMLLTLVADSFPKLDDFKTDYRIFSSPSKKLITFPLKSSVERIYYIGILPLTKKVVRNLGLWNLQNQTKSDGTSVVNYTLAAYVSRCLYWDNETLSWKSDGCHVGNETTELMIHCICSHLSVFSASFLIAPNVVEITYTMDLLKRAHKNPIVIICVSLIWLFYFILVIWAYKQDKIDSMKACLIELDDNPPQANYFYILVIYTGLQQGNGTTARVFCKIWGEHRISGIRRLASANYQVFQRGSEEWFLFATESSLGGIEKIAFWHDNSGVNPSWFLRRVVLRDLQTNQTWLFFAKRWLSLDCGDFQPMCEIQPATEEDMKDLILLFKEVTVRTFQDGHLWFSIISRPPRSNFTRVERLTCALCLLLSAMLSNIMFYGIDVMDPDDQMEFRHFYISLSELVIGMESALICFPISLLIISLFRNISPRPESLVKHRTWKKDTGALSDVPVNIPDSQVKATSAKSEQLENTISENRSAKSNSPVDTGSANSDQPGRTCGNEQLTCLSGTGKDASGQTLNSSCMPGFSGDFSDNTKHVGIDEPIAGSSMQECLAKTKTIVQPILSLESDDFKGCDIVSDNQVTIFVAELHRKQENAEKSEYLYIIIEKLKTFSQKMTGCLPWWFIYVAWTLSMVTSVLCSFFVILYSLTYGYERSTHWLVSLVTSFLHSVLVLQTLKVIIVAAVVCLIIRKPQELDEGNKDYLHQRTIRSGVQTLNAKPQPPFVYQPLSEEAVNELRRIRKNELHIYNTLYEIFLFSVFFVTVMVNVHGQRAPLAFYGVLTAKSMFVNKQYEGTLKLKDILDFETAMDYLNNTLIPNLHAEVWYNNDTITTLGYTSDYVTRLVGVPRLRQLRTKDTCQVEREFLPRIKKCEAAYSWYKQDMKDYFPGWYDHDVNVTKRKHPDMTFIVDQDPWKYRSSMLLLTMPVSGILAVYSGGGYVVELGRTRKWSSSVLTDLITDKWFDSRTRAVFVEFTLYNPNSDLYTSVLILLEFSAYGEVIASAEIHCSRLHIHASKNELLIGISQLTFVVFLFYFIIREFFKIKKLGFSYLTRWWNVLELAIICLCIVVISIYFQRASAVRNALKQNDPVTSQKFVNFYVAAFWDDLLQVSEGVLVMVLVVKLWKLLSFSPYIQMPYITLLRGANSLSHYIIILFIVLMAFVSFCHVVFGQSQKHMKSVGGTIYVLVAIAAGCVSNFDVFTRENKAMGQIFVAAFTITIGIFVIAMFYSILTDSFATTIVNLYSEEVVPTKQIADYMVHQTKIILGLTSMSWVERIRYKLRRERDRKLTVDQS